MNTILKNYDKVREQILTRKANRDSISRIITGYKAEIESIKIDMHTMTESSTLMKSFYGTLRTDVVSKFEELLTNGVQQIYNKDYKITIEFQDMANSVYADFFVTLPDGKKMSLKSGAGGLRDFIAVLQRILYIILEPSKPSKIIFLDENLKALDSGRASKAFKFISDLLKELDIQAIFITHSDAAKAMIGDKNTTVLEIMHDGVESSCKPAVL